MPPDDYIDATMYALTFGERGKERIDEGLEHLDTFVRKWSPSHWLVGANRMANGDFAIEARRIDKHEWEVASVRVSQLMMRASPAPELVVLDALKDIARQFGEALLAKVEDLAREAVKTWNAYVGERNEALARHEQVMMVLDGTLDKIDEMRSKR